MTVRKADGLRVRLRRMWTHLWVQRCTVKHRETHRRGPEADMSHLLASAKEGLLRHTRRTPREELTQAELERFDAQSEQRYRTMTGMDEPLSDRAERARKHALSTPFSDKKPW